MSRFIASLDIRQGLFELFVITLLAAWAAFVVSMLERGARYLLGGVFS